MVLHIAAVTAHVTWSIPYDCKMCCGALRQRLPLETIWKSWSRPLTVVMRSR
ncbi:hypothetical protein PT974_09018 [Cladobotryum mycophilum]|uniref:Uncharacterized protein n=1 Tax=Cladobotryum mycophilum TaxID=491253 RepID=A0ABR0SF11_9HYPO